MKYLTIITSTLMLLASHASATEFEGRMECKVKSNKVMEIEEGVAKEYTGFTDGFVVGDTLILTYGKDEKERTDSLFLRIKNNVSIVPDFFIFIHIAQENIRFWTDDETNGAGLSSILDRLYITPDTVSGTWSGSQHVKLNRYYKNDWQGMVTKNYGSKVHVFTLNCRHKKDELEQMIQYVSRQSLVSEQAALIKAIEEVAGSGLTKLQKEAVISVRKLRLDKLNKRIAELEAAQE